MIWQSKNIIIQVLMIMKLLLAISGIEGPTEIPLNFENDIYTVTSSIGIARF